MRLGDPGFSLNVGDLVRGAGRLHRLHHMVGVVIEVDRLRPGDAIGVAWVEFPSPMGERVLGPEEIEIVSKVKKKII